MKTLIKIVVLMIFALTISQGVDAQNKLKNLMKQTEKDLKDANKKLKEVKPATASPDKSQKEPKGAPSSNFSVTEEEMPVEEAEKEPVQTTTTMPEKKKNPSSTGNATGTTPANTMEQPKSSKSSNLNTQPAAEPEKKTPSGK